MAATRTPADRHGSQTGASGSPPEITRRAMILGLATTVGMILYVIYVSQRTGVGSFVHSQLPLLALMPFVLWLFANVGLARIWPAKTLKTGELLTILAMLWIVGTLPGWLGRWASIVASPTHFASNENQYAEHFFDYLPWHVLTPTTARVLDSFWLGLPEGAPIPWDGWIGVTLQWLGVSLAMVVFGLCLFVLFQVQWEEREKLTFPLAQLPPRPRARNGRAAKAPRAVSPPPVLGRIRGWCCCPCSSTSAPISHPACCLSPSTPRSSAWS